MRYVCSATPSRLTNSNCDKPIGGSGFRDRRFSGSGLNGCSIFVFDSGVSTDNDFASDVGWAENAIAMDTRPWTSGPKELLGHAVGLLESGTAFDCRMAMISHDNVEEAIKYIQRVA